MKPFMNEDFLLATSTAKELYHNWAESMPILDYHCHIDPREIAALTGCFQGGGVARVQQGSARWFNDHRAGMEKQLTSLGNLGLLGNFIGMLTDSRSFLSYPRHEILPAHSPQSAGRLGGKRRVPRRHGASGADGERHLL